MDTPIILSPPISFKRLEQFSTIVDTNEPDDSPKRMNTRMLNTITASASSDTTQIIDVIYVSNSLDFIDYLLGE